MTVDQKIRSQLEAERDQARARLKVEGMPDAQIDYLLGVASAMHAEQVACVARAIGIEHKVVMH